MLTLLTEMNAYRFLRLQSNHHQSNFDFVERNLQLSFNIVHMSKAVTDEKVSNINTTVGVLIEGVDYFVDLKTKKGNK